MAGRILIVDDEEHIREILKATVSSLADSIFMADSANQGLHIIENENIDVVICDIQMPGINGLEFLKKVKEEQPDIYFLMITAFGSMQTVIEAMRLGASDFLTKPFENNKVREIIAHLLNRKNDRKEPVIAPVQGNQFEGIIGDSHTFHQCIKLSMKAAHADSSVLILGESGTGKEVFAKMIHDHSNRKDGPIIPINCGAIPENLMESELFGYKKGAFTGALEGKPGKFSLAHNGTVFLDEIGEMPLPLQVKLLRVLQEKEIDPVGGTQSQKIDFRLIAATNQNLEQAVANGEFREDLYYRLNIIPITLPPLRDRGEDVLLLAEHFLAHFNQRYDNHFCLSEDDNKLLTGYSWPGNIRELENIIERGVVLGDEGKLAIQLPKPLQKSSESVSQLKSQKKEHEKTQILKALDTNRWNKTKTAHALGISRRSLLYKIKEYSIQ